MTDEMQTDAHTGNWSDQEREAGQESAPLGRHRLRRVIIGVLGAAAPCALTAGCGLLGTGGISSSEAVRDVCVNTAQISTTASQVRPDFGKMRSARLWAGF